MKENTHVIWSDINLNLDDWRDDLKQTYPNADDNFLYEVMYENNASYLYDERINLDIQLPREIIVIADLGLWNGRRSGYKVIESGNIRDCLYSDCDFNEWYGDMRVHYLDVGQGDCAFIELSNGQTMLIDARNPQSRAEIVNYIKSLQYSI